MVILDQDQIPVDAPPGTTPTTGDQGNIDGQEGSKTTTRPGGKKEEVDFDIIGDDDNNQNWDLIASGDFVIPDDIDSLDSPPDFGGVSALSINIESHDDNTFEVVIETLNNAEDKVLTTIDSNFDPRLERDFVFVRLEAPTDKARITITDTSGAAQNHISGSINAH